MDIIEEAKKFAETVKLCPEIINLREANEKLQANEVCKKKFDEFRVVQIEAYNEKMQKGEVSEETKAKFMEFSDFMPLNPDFTNYIMAEQKFGETWEQVMGILTEAVSVNQAQLNTK